METGDCVESAAPMVIEPNKPTLGLRLIALLEAAKGILGVALGIALASLAGHHMHPFIQWIVRHFHLTDSAHAPHFVVEMLAHPERFRLEIWTVLGMFYAALRFTEAYGLWFARRWAEWLALVSAALYVPFEIYAICLGATLLKVVLLLMNIAFVMYLAMVLAATRRKRAQASAAGEAPVRDGIGTNATGE
jgi:uncharacterized membrane protein (DUF2068 family)